MLSEKYSRREADELVAKGCVTINGRVATNGDMASPSDFVKLNGKRVPFPTSRIVLPSMSASLTMVGRHGAGGSRSVKADAPPVYIVYFKPHGVECTTDQRIPGNIVDAIGALQFKCCH